MPEGKRVEREWMARGDGAERWNAALRKSCREGNMRNDTMERKITKA
jgi:hypothetical protein